jgi:COPII coat assembly protein SEC16
MILNIILVQEFAPQNLLIRATQSLQPPTPLVPQQTTPRTPNFAASVPLALSPAALVKWPETVAMIIFSPLSAETSATLTALGDQLTSAQLHEAAHVW